MYLSKCGSSCQSNIKKTFLTFKISLSKIFNQHVDQIKELDTTLNFKRVVQNIKIAEKNLNRLEKYGITVTDMTFTNKVPQTDYSVVYKVKINPKKKLIVKKIIRRKK